MNRQFFEYRYPPIGIRRMQMNPRVVDSGALAADEWSTVDGSTLKYKINLHGGLYIFILGRSDLHTLTARSSKRSAWAKCPVDLYNDANAKSQAYAHYEGA